MRACKDVLVFSEQPITTLKGVGAQVAEKFHRLNLHTLQDLVFHLPLRYQDRTRVTPIGALRLHSDVVIEGEIRAADIAFTGKTGGKEEAWYVAYRMAAARSPCDFFIFPPHKKTS